MFDWDDLKVLLAVAREGSTGAAGRALGIDQSTVQRRLSDLERRLGIVLVRREARGYQLTDTGRALLANAEEVQQAIRGFEQQVILARDAASGNIRFTCPEPIARRLSGSPVLERFRAAYPDLRVEFVLSDRYLDLSKGEADIALRSGDTDAEELLGRKVGDSLWALYSSRDYWERQGRPGSLDHVARLDWIGFDEAMAQHRAEVWLRRTLPDARVVVRNRSVLGAIESAKAGLGVAALPVAVADAEPSLVRVTGPIPELTRIWRVLTTAELRKQARVAALFDHLVAEAEALRPILTG